MANSKNTAGKRVFDNAYSFPQDSQDLADDIYAFSNARVGPSTGTGGRQTLPAAQRKVGMIWPETDTGIVYLDTASSGWSPTGVRFIGCKLRRSSAQSFNSGTFTTITWNSETFDVGNMYNAATPDQVVAPVTGLYRVDATAGFGPAITGRVGLQFLKNGIVEWGGNMVNPSSGADVSAQASTLISMAAGDLLTVQLFQESGVARNSATSAYAGPTLTVQLVGGI